MRIKIRHEILQSFTPPAKGVIEVLRLSPRGYEGQHVLDWRIDVEADCRLRRSEDAFGNLADTFSLQAPTQTLRILAEGSVETFDCAGVVRAAAERFPHELFLRDTELTAPDAGLRALAAQSSGADMIARLHALMRRVRDHMKDESEGEGEEKEKESDEGGRSAGRALARGRGGPCDLAHVFVAAARCLGAPARFVSGYVLREGAQTGALHAWAEAHVAGVGWIGFDCAQVICPTERHVRVACGLDRLDAAPVRASSRSAIAQEARVELRPAGALRQSQQ
jgi:transglutaminase-like putative cysteine protease